MINRMKKWSVYLSEEDRAFIRQVANDCNWKKVIDGKVTEADCMRIMIDAFRQARVKELAATGDGQYVTCSACNKSWLMDTLGSYICPYCGEYDGDHHLHSRT
jgi:hypothetical protein